MGRGRNSLQLVSAAGTRGHHATRPRRPWNSYREAMRLGERIPEGASGDWRVVRHTVSEEDAKFEALRAALNGSRRRVPAGSYTGLEYKGALWMSDTPDEMSDHAEVFSQADERGGRWLINGLGLGMVTQALLSLDNVEHVDVVEIDPDVIALVAPAFQEEVEAGRLTIHCADAYTVEWPPGTSWDGGAWHDIWRDLCTDNLAEMTKLHRKYGRRVGWQGSWCQEELRYHRQRERRHSPW